MKVETEQAFLQLVAAEQAKVIDQFDYPEHPLVIRHAAVLNLIKQRMVAVKLTSEVKDGFELVKWPLKKIEKFESDKGLRLPDELKVYLMEIGEYGNSYFYLNGVSLPVKNKDVTRMKKPFPITPDKMHQIGRNWNEGWINPDNNDGWLEVGINQTEEEPGTLIWYTQEELDTLFGLPPGASMEDGCMFLAYATIAHDKISLIMNGVFEGEVWIDTLQYGADAGGCFSPASRERLKLLAFIAESLLEKQKGHVDMGDLSGSGIWM
ncbi:hypothetical protein SAMN05518672_10676 [Chitinophaga sp. CF118]|uniref:hypothetical protein n=1 Tax=Chitinophaga sp. CF118 TaxID=1884367 RepID=UPI0008E77C7B|nr:hypothetical protein [Chitinophaga sp. CF118]SFE42346.1 hypothetical protein SAMN05518672_10676 [Chitinophaga sp. CF118]